MAWLKRACALWLCLSLAGCSAYTKYDRSALANRPPATETGTAVISVGQTVKVHTTDGAVVKGSLESMEDAALVVGGQHIPHSQVEAIWVRSFQWAPTLAVTAVVAMVYVMVTYSEGTFSPNDW